VETATSKVGLRRQIHAKLATLTTDDVYARSAAICRQLAAVRELASAQWVMGFVSFGSEVRTHELLRSLLAEGRHLCVPSFDVAGQRYICSELKHFDEDLKAGLLGILEPRPVAIRPVHADRIDAWLVPGVAFDEHGNRLGRGMGYYDRLLCGVHGVKIALAYDFQVLNEVPSEPHDVRMDFIVTETKVVHCKKD
jgi:5-formyltetrahydrofolate cyclo-ligase